MTKFQLSVGISTFLVASGLVIILLLLFVEVPNYKEGFMMKKVIWVLLMVGFLVSGAAFAEGPTDESTVQLKNGEEIVVISKEELKKLLAETAVKPKTDKEAEQARRDSLWQDPQNIFSVGYDMSWPFYGLSFVYWPNRHGFGLNYYSDQGAYYHTNISHISLRYYYSIKPELYFCAGLGKYSDDREDYDYDNWEYVSYHYDETLLGLALGIRYTDYGVYEFGYGLALTNQGRSYSSVCFGLDLKFDFKL